MPKINIYTIIDPLQIQKSEGGGHQSSNDLINAMEKCGFETNVVVPKDYSRFPPSDYLNVFIDPFNDPEGSTWFTRKQLREICNAAPYIWMECAYTSFTTGPYGCI